MLFYPNAGDGTFGDIRLAVAGFGYVAGGWRVDRHPRMLAPLVAHADGRRYVDIVGFSDDGVFAAFNQGDGSFTGPRRVSAGFGADAGWRVDRHPRFVADLTGDGSGDLVGFFDDGIWATINDGTGNFAAPRRIIEDFGFVDGGWRVDKRPRLLADLTGDGRADVVGFGNAGVWASLNDGGGTF